MRIDVRTKRNNGTMPKTIWPENFKVNLEESMLEIYGIGKDDAKQFFGTFWKEDLKIVRIRENSVYARSGCDAYIPLKLVSFIRTHEK